MQYPNEPNFDSSFTIISRNSQDHNVTSGNGMQNPSTSNDEFISHMEFIPFNSEQQQNRNDNTLMQPMTPSQAVQIIQNFQTPPMEYPQESVCMARHSFYYSPCNDDHIYHIICEETDFYEVISHLINNFLYSSHSTHSYIFYFQQPNDKRIYQVSCEMINIYVGEINQNEQQQRVEFSNELRENLEFYLKQNLVNYLAPKDGLFMNDEI
ncbi:6822_t:CDS:1 [Funneliformis caledonium]|uniref:6822_t:CDS:1 n=1 Tax=Funneliformis caledonium TaxID=1117310 RepID=A0A9N9GBK2_9GLOM|nr:6822_t:CDS:1 [Funneliformis caledonium]